MDEGPGPGGAYSGDLTMECGQVLVGRVPGCMEAGGWVCGADPDGAGVGLM